MNNKCLNLKLLVFVVLLGFYCCGCLDLYAQEDKRFSLNLDNRDLPTVLKLIEKCGGKTIIFSYNDTEKYTVSAEIENKTEAEAINMVILKTNLVSREYDEYFVVSRRDDVSSYSEIKGHVYDEAGKPLSYVNVLLLSAIDSTFVKGGVTDVQGRFNFMASSQQPYLLKATFIGYSPLCVPCRVGNNDINLVPDIQTLKEVVVEGHRLLMENKGNGLLVNVAGTFLEKMGSAADLLTHLPSVTGRDGNYNVLGRGTPIIYVNNRKIRNNDDLNALSAQDVQSAEVIMTPGAEYSSDVSAVIKIRTIRKSGDGLSGNANVFYSQGKWAVGNELVSLNYRVKDLDVFGKVSFDQVNSYGEVENKNILYGNSEWEIVQNDIQTSRRNPFSVDIGFDYALNANHSFGARYMPSGILNNARRRIESDAIAYKDGIAYESSLINTDYNGFCDNTHAVNSYYAGIFNGWTVNVDADLYYANNGVKQNSYNNGIADIWSKSNVNSSLYAVKAVVAGALWKGRLSFGTEDTYTDRREIFSQSGFAFDVDDHVRQTALSAFVDYSIPLKKWIFDVGLRYEYQNVDYYEFENKNEEQSPVYRHLMPVVSVRWADGPFSCGLSYKIQKFNPPYGFLSSGIEYRSKYQYVQGSPLLQPGRYHFLDFNFGWKWINADLAYGDTKNKFVDMVMPYNEKTHPGTLLFKHTSIPSRMAYLNLNLSPKIGVWQTVFTCSVGLSYPDVDDYEIKADKHEPVCQFFWDNNFEFLKGWMLNVNAWIQLDAESAYSIQKRSGGVSARLVKSFFNDALTVTLSLDDMLRTGYYYFNLYGINSYMENKIYRDWQRVGVRVAYRFNAAKSKYKGTGAGQTEKRRL